MIAKAVNIAASPPSTHAIGKPVKINKIKLAIMSTARISDPLMFYCQLDMSLA